MTKDQATLSTIATADLRTLHAATESGRLRTPMSERSLVAAGFSHLSEALVPLCPLDQRSLVAVLDALLAERDRPRPEIELVWTGPERSRATTRDTAVVVKQLFAEAKKSVLVAGFAFDDGAEIFEPLHQGIKERNLDVSVFMDIGRAPSEGTRNEHVQVCVDRFFAKNWPFGPPLPAVYYDPRTTASDSIASLHAKCIVIDDEKSLVTSANFTNRGQNRNIEVGALISDPAFSANLTRQWMTLAAGGMLKQVKA